MPNISGIVYSKSNGGSMLFDGEYSKMIMGINSNLPKNRKYNVGLDQSTACTGLYLEDEMDDIIILLEFPSINMFRDEYLDHLAKVLELLFEDVPVNYFVMEDIPNGKYVRASSVLRELKGKISGWIKYIPTLESATKGFILPQSWKSKVVDKTKSKNRHKDKYLIACDICDKKPILRKYLTACKNKDYDGFDACGVWLGFKAKNFTEDGRKVVNATKENRHTPIAFIRYLDARALNNERAVLGDLLGYSKTGGLSVLEYNTEYSLYENIRMCSSIPKHKGKTNKPLSLVALTDSSIQDILHWETDEPYDDGKVFIMVVGRKTDLKGFIPGLSRTHHVLVAD